MEMAQTERNYSPEILQLKKKIKSIETIGIQKQELVPGIPLSTEIDSRETILLEIKELLFWIVVISIINTFILLVTRMWP